MAAGALGALVWAIVAGTPTTGDPAVVAIAHRPVTCGDTPVVSCSGVLIAPRVVLTAAHCVENSPSRGTLEVLFGSDANAPSAVIVVQSTQVFDGYDPMTGDGDLALLLLADAASVTPIGLPTGSVDDLASAASLRAVGFGVTAFAANDSGIKREGTLSLGAIRAASFDATPSPSMTCTADSGGPVFATIGNSEELVGITSRGDAGCIANAVNARVDIAIASFVDPYLTASSSAPAGWPASTSFFTDTCTIDEMCPALMSCEMGRCGFRWLGYGRFGGSCIDDAGCGTGRCVRAWPTGIDACHCFTEDTPPMPGDPGPIDDWGDDDGCCSGSGGASGASLLVLVALARAAKRKLFHARDQRRA